MIARIGAPALLALAGCATPVIYGAIDPATSAYGYRDSRNLDGAYTLLVVTNDAALAHEFWDRRAVELCGGPNFHKNIFRAERPVHSYTGYASNGYAGGAYTEDRYGDFFLEGYLRCDSVATSPEAPTADAPPAVEGARDPLP